MKQVRVYQTKDGQTFTDRMKAEDHELMVNLRGIIQSHVKGTSFTASEVAGIFAQNQDKVFDTIGKYRRTMGSIKGSQTRIG